MNLEEARATVAVLLHKESYYGEGIFETSAGDWEISEDSSICRRQVTLQSEDSSQRMKATLEVVFGEGATIVTARTFMGKHGPSITHRTGLVVEEKYNEDIGAKTCKNCGGSFTLHRGPAPFVAGTWDPVCEGCAKGALDITPQESETTG